jgi:hypothetical protein
VKSVAGLLFFGILGSRFRIAENGSNSHYEKTLSADGADLADF